MLNQNNYKKLQDNLHLLRDGDILFTRGSSFLARAIQLIDGCYFNHCGVIYKSGSHWYVLESLSEGATVSFLNKRVMLNRDFTIRRPKGYYPGALNNLLKDAADCKCGEGYDFFLLLKVAFRRIFGFGSVSDNKGSLDICSELVRRYTDALGIIEYGNAAMKARTGSEVITPNDFLKGGMLDKVV